MTTYPCPFLLLLGEVFVRCIVGLVGSSVYSPHFTSLYVSMQVTTAHHLSLCQAALSPASEHSSLFFLYGYRTSKVGERVLGFCSLVSPRVLSISFTKSKPSLVPPGASSRGEPSHHENVLQP